MITLGQQVIDPLTGFTGIVTCRSEYLHGCVRLCVQPRSLHNGTMVNEEWFDEARLEDTSLAATTPATGGGPARPVDPSR